MSRWYTKILTQADRQVIFQFLLERTVHKKLKGVYYLKRILYFHVRSTLFKEFG